MNFKRLWVLFFLTACAAGHSSMSWAADYTLTPSVLIREEYNDNVNLSSSDKEHDYITTVSPTIHLDDTTKSLTLSLDAGVEYRYYALHTEGMKLNYLGNLESLLTAYKDIFFIRTGDKYERITIDIRNQVALDNVSANVTERNNFVTNPYVLFPLSDTVKAKIGYTYQNIWYSSSSGDDLQDHMFEGELDKELSAKISAFLKCDYVIHRPAMTEAYDSQAVSLGLNYQVSPKLFLSGAIGETWFNFAENASAAANTTVGSFQGGNGNSSGKTWNANAKYLLTELVTLSAGGSDNYADSVNVGTYRRVDVFANISYVGNVTVTLNGYNNTDDYITVIRKDRTTGVDLDLAVPFSSRITGNLKGRYAHYSFLPEDEKVNRYGAKVSFDYALKIMTLSLGYTYNESDSHTTNNSYKNNIIWLQAKFIL